MPHPYATIDQVTTAYPPLLTSIGVGSFEVSSVAVSSWYIWAAQGVVDAYLANRYVVPLNDVPPAITRATVDIVIYDIMRDRGLKMSEALVARYDNSMDMLKGFGVGKLKIPGATEVSTGDNEAFSPGQAYKPVFSPVLAELDQQADPDFIENELTRRGITVSS